MQRQPQYAHQAPLAAGWEECVDPRTGRTYYKNHVTKTTQWERPSVQVNQPRGDAALPHGWEKRVDPRTGRPYYVDHINKRTAWEAPVAEGEGKVESAMASMSLASPTLPSGWSAKVDPRTGRTYFSNHITKTTQWERPTAPATGFAGANPGGGAGPQRMVHRQPPQAPSAPPGDDRRERAISIAKQKSESESVSKHDMYLAVLRAVIVDGKLDSVEESLLSEIRQQHNIPYEMHEKLLREVGLTDQDVASLKQRAAEAPSGPQKRDCVFCLDATPDHIVLDCMHMCLCGECAELVRRSPQPQKCPVCRGNVRDIKKVF